MLESRAPPEMRNGHLLQSSNSYKYHDSKFSYNLVVLANARKAGGAEMREMELLLLFELFLKSEH